MVSDADRDTVSERLLNVPRVMLRWASPPAGRTGQTGQTGAAGCLNPLTALRMIVVLAGVALMPLWLLPLLLVRMVTVGRTSIRYSSVLDLASGPAARWGYDALDPPADAASVQDGLRAIAAHDPGLAPAALMNWAAAATSLICQSLTSADAAPARTFMSNGLFRAHLALLELRDQAGVQCQAAWQATRADIVEAAATPLLDEVRVRVSCAGWCWERHADTGLTLRGGQDQRTWVEDLTFGRSASATTPPAGGLPARHCPSCGALLDLDPDGTCRYCRGVVTAGRHDWVLIAWRREPW
jgi:hypothetical protein